MKKTIIWIGASVILILFVLSMLGTFNQVIDFEKDRSKYKEETISIADDAFHYFSQKKYDSAIERYFEALKSDSTFYDAWRYIAFVYHEQSIFDSAFKYYEIAVSKNPGDFEASCNLGTICLLNLNDYENAIFYLDKAIQLRFDYFQAYYYKGLALEYLERYEEAIECYDKAEYYNECYTKAINSKAAVLQDLGKYEKALEIYQKAIDCDPSNLIYSKNKANLLRYLDREKEALETINNYLVYDPENDAARSLKDSLLGELN